MHHHHHHHHHGHHHRRRQCLATANILLFIIKNQVTQKLFSWSHGTHAIGRPVLVQIYIMLIDEEPSIFSAMSDQIQDN